MARRAWWQELEAIVYIVSAVRRQREMNVDIQLIVFFSQSRISGEGIVSFS